MKRFIWGHKYWVDRSVLGKLNVGEKGAIQEALDQIHKRSILEKNGEGKRSYRGVLVEEHERQDNGFEEAKFKDKVEEPWQTVTYKRKKNDAPNSNKMMKEVTTIFLHSKPECYYM